MDTCLITLSGTCKTKPHVLSSGRISFIVECNNSAKSGPFLVIVMAEAAAVSVMPAAGDYIVVSNASYYDDTRAGARFGVYASCAGTVNIAAHYDGAIPAETLL